MPYEVAIVGTYGTMVRDGVGRGAQMRVHAGHPIAFDHNPRELTTSSVRSFSVKLISEEKAKQMRKEELERLKDNTDPRLAKYYAELTDGRVAELREKFAAAESALKVAEDVAAMAQCDVEKRRQDVSQAAAELSQHGVA